MDFAQQLKSSLDIADVVGERVRLKRIGGTPRYMGLCPFHTEKTPSFSVHSGLQIYKCFGCGAFGDVFRFIQEMEHITFFEAVKMLAERYGHEMPKRSDYGDRDSRLREAIHHMNEIALRLYRDHLLSPQGTESRHYLATRNVSMETAEQFGLGLADRSGSTLTNLLQKEGFTPEQLEHSGLVTKRQEGTGFYDYFRGRLIFPIHSEQSKVVGFAGRALQKGEEPKYLNSRETEVYKKSQLLYNLNRAKDSARKNERFLLVEGYMDVIGLSAAGIAEVVASCGTALTHGQVKLMKRFADQVVVNFDPDTAGARGAAKSIEVLLDENARVRVLALPEDLDPDEYIGKYGAGTYLTLITRAPNYYFWLADQARSRFDSATAEGRQRALQFLLPAIHRIPDRIERAGVAGDLASYLGVDRGMLLDQFKKAAIDQRDHKLKFIETPVPPVETLLLKTVLLHPGLRGELLPQLSAQGVIDQLRLKSIFEALAALYRAQPAFRYEDLEARLEQKDATLLSNLVFADELQETDIEAVRLDALSCLRTLEAKALDLRIANANRQMTEELARGDQQQALRTAVEIDTLKRQRTRVRPTK